MTSHLIPLSTAQDEKKGLFIISRLLKPSPKALLWSPMAANKSQKSSNQEKHRKGRSHRIAGLQ